MLVKSKPVIFKVLSQFVCLYLVVQGTPVPWMEHIWSVTWLCTLLCLQKYAHIFVSKEETFIRNIQQHNMKSKICTFQIWYFSRQNSNEITLIWKILSISFSFLYRQDFGLSELTVKKKVLLPTFHSHSLHEPTYDKTCIESYLEMTLCNKFHRSKILCLYFALS